MIRLAILSPISWRTPPRHYGPWENVVSLLSERLVQLGVDVTLFATGDSETSANLRWVAPRSYSEDSSMDPKVWECLHISRLFEEGSKFDLIHNHFDFLPLSYSGLLDTPIVTTIHGFSSPSILPVYKKYNEQTHYVAISESDKSADLDYIATIHHGIDLSQFPLQPKSNGYLLFFGRIHGEKGVYEAIQVAKKTGKKLIVAGIIQDADYYAQQVEPYEDGESVEYVGSVGPERRAELLGGADALLHLINFDEPFGLSVVEAMACGTPVIAFERGSMPEIVKDAETGFLVSDLDEAIEAVAKVPSISREACRAHVEQRFTAERMARDYLKVYQQVLDMRENYRPWGHYENMQQRADHNVKRIVVEPGKRLSLQKHAHRAEHWLIVSGEALVTRNEEEIALSAGQSVDIPIGAAHRIMNPGTEPLVFIEVQLGSYFGEDDIVRLEDDFGRS